MLVDLVKIYIASADIGSIVLGQAAPAFRGVEALIDGQSYSYSIQTGENYEAGVGTYFAAQRSLARGPIISSKGGAAIDVPSGTALTFTLLASDVMHPTADPNALQIEIARAQSVEAYLAQQILSSVAGVTPYDTLADLRASPNVRPGTSARVFADPNPANNTVYITKTGNAANYVVDTDYLNAIASTLQPLVDAAQLAATQATTAAEDATEAAEAFSLINADDLGFFGNDANYTCDAYGCVFFFTDSDSVAHFVAISVAGQNTGAIVESDNGYFGNDLSYSVDVYGCVYERIDSKGFTYELTAPRQYIEVATPDGITRRSVGGYTLLPVYGESTSIGNPNGEPQVSKSQPYSNLTGEYGPATAPGGATPLRPLYEAKPEYTSRPNETPCSGFCNMASEYAFRQYGVLPSDMPLVTGSFGQGGQTVASLSPGGSSTHYETWLMPAIDNVINAAKAAGKDLKIPAWLFLCGANDGGAGTTYNVMLAGLIALAARFDTDVRAKLAAAGGSITPQTTPSVMLLYQTSGCFDRASILPILQAQFDAPDKSPLIEYAGNWQDLQFVDGVHCPGPSYQLAGNKHGVAGAQVLFEGKTSRLGRPLNAWYQAGQLKVRFDTPITIDAVNLGAVKDYGVAVSDAAGAIPLGAIEANDDVLTVSLGRPPGASPVVEFARTYQAAGTTSGGCATNIRSAYVDTFVWGGVAKRVYRWAAHARIPVLSLEH